MNEIENIEKIIGYEFKNKKLIELAFVHSSCGVPNNERLEFLGDAILDMVVADVLFSATTENEGSLTKKRATMVCEENLANVIQHLGLIDFIKLGGSFKEKPSKAVCADLFESIVGAIYLDNNHSLPQVTEFIMRHMDKSVCNAIDYKSALQELIQKNKNTTFNYVTNRVDEDAGEPKFESKLYINGKFYSKGVGKTKKEAERNTAKIAYERLKGKTNDI